MNNVFKVLFLKPPNGTPLPGTVWNFLLEFKLFYLGREDTTP